MREHKQISVADTGNDTEQPRKAFDPQDLIELGENMLAHGQQVPVIVYCPEIIAGDAGAKRYRLLDGERRWRAAQLVGITQLDAIVLGERPNSSGLRVIQLSLDAHRQSLTPMERSDLLQRIRVENDWHISELSTQLSMRQPLVTKLLAYQKLDPTIQAMLHAGQIDTERAYIISQEADPARQRELVQSASQLSREELRQKVKRVCDAAAAKATNARFPLSAGLCVSVQGRDLTLGSAIDAIVETVRELKKGQSQGLNISTLQRVMRDKAKKR